MSLSLYDVSVPVFTRGLGALDRLIGKAEEFAATRKIEPAVLLQARLAPDMFPFARQVQIATFFAGSGAARPIGQEPPVHPEEEPSFATLHARIARTVAYLQGLDRAAFEGAELRAFDLTLGGEDYSFTGLTFLTHAALPNFYFHVTTAYAILRHNGLEIGKRDFLGG
jgi:uncharacterized protein